MIRDHEQSETRPISERLAGLLDYANSPIAKRRELKSDVSEQVADYIKAVRDKDTLPPHAYLDTGFFTDTSGRAEALVANEAKTGVPPWAPVAPLPQEAWLAGADATSVRKAPAPDPGRRVQHWWAGVGDERAARPAVFVHPHETGGATL